MAFASAYLTNFKPTICHGSQYAKVVKHDRVTQLPRSTSKLTRATSASKDIFGTDLALKKEIQPHHDQTVTWLLSLNGIRRMLSSSFLVLCFLSTPQDKSIEEWVQHLNDSEASWVQIAEHPSYAGSISVPGAAMRNPSATISGLIDITQVNSERRPTAAIHIHPCVSADGVQHEKDRTIARSSTVMV